MKIIIGADIVPTKINSDLFQSGNVEELIGEELVRRLASADYRIFNLETPLSDEISPIEKWGPNLCAPSKTINGIKIIGADLVTIANNHIMDQGEKGFRSTIELLNDNDIDYVGGGDCLKNAVNPYLIEKNGISIGVYACAENEFSIAGENSCGANPYDPLYSFDHVSELKKKCDKVIVLYHGGKEHYRYPSPELQKACRRFVDKGADVVVCQHSHCIGCMENYSGGMIVYGQGNFLFRSESNEYWNTALLIELEIKKNIEAEFIPLCVHGSGVRIANDQTKTDIIRSFEGRSKEILNEGCIEANYNAFSDLMLRRYMNSLFGDNLLFKVLDRLSGKKLCARISRKKRLRLINYIKCEAHRELFLTGLARKT